MQMSVSGIHILKVTVSFLLICSQGPGKSRELESQLRPTMDREGFMTDTTFTHHNYSEMVHWLTLLSRSYPKITRLYSIGKSVQQRELYVLEISDNPGLHEPGLISLFDLFLTSSFKTKPNN